LPAKTPATRRLVQILFGRILRQHLRRPPRRMIKQPFELHEITDDDTRIFSSVHARSPANVRALMKRHKARDAGELMPHLPDNHYHVHPLDRLVDLLMRAFGERIYDTAVSGLTKDLKRARRLPKDGILGKSKGKSHDQ